jgi:hypothetical protein
MALSLAITETAWNATTSPKTAVIADATDQDWLFVLAGGDDFEPGSDVTAASVSTTVGTTTGWIEQAKQLAGTSADWMLLGTAEVTATASVTVSVSRTQSGTPGNWGFYVVRARDCAGPGNVASKFTSDSTKVVSLAVSAADSAVAFLSTDWDVGTVGTGWDPVSGAVLVERSVFTDYTVHAAYWEAQAAGTRNYGSTGGAGTKYRCMAIEILAAAAGPPPEGPHNSDAMQFMGKAYY